MTSFTRFVALSKFIFDAYYNIDLSQSWMVGDGKNDIQAGKNARCHTAFIGTEDFGQDLTVDSLLHFVEERV